jgi:hypothetical protein
MSPFLLSEGARPNLRNARTFSHLLGVVQLSILGRIETQLQTPDETLVG